MQFFIFLSTVVLQLYSTFAFPASENELFVGAATSSMAAPGQNYIKGYECGNTFFTDDEVKEYVSLCLEPNNPYVPKVYHGPLYSDTQYSEYTLWPIKKGRKKFPANKSGFTPFYVVFKRKENEVIDVISRVTNQHFAKCTKIYSFREEPSTSISEITNGYYCSHEFVGDEKIQESVSQAQTQMGGSLGYPAPYVGNLYPEHSRYKIWPILIGKEVHEVKNNAGPYFIVINGEGMLIDVVVRGFDGNFLRCIRSRKTPKALVSDSSSNLIELPPRGGFQCGKVFFDDETLNDAAIMALGASSQKNFGYPNMYSGDPFNRLCWLWPISKNGRFTRKGPPGPYRVVLSLDFKVMTVAIFEKGRKVKPCDRKTLKARKEHDSSDYVCDTDYFSLEWLIQTLEVACQRLRSKSNLRYPAKYEGPRFTKDGPYYTYPIFLDKLYHKMVGRHRVVMNQECELVGALTTIGYMGQVILIKCRRLEDGPVPNEPYYDPNQPIYEHFTKF